MSNTILITGAAGSLGKELTQLLVSKGNIVRAFDINEAGLASLKNDNIRLLYGDIQNKERVDFAMEGVDIVIHVAAMKNLEITEFNVEEAIRTNILGTLNIAKAAAKKKVKKMIFVSSDKAVEPVNIYGSTKDIGEKIWLWASRVIKDTNYMICRMGNFELSSGSVLHVWGAQWKRGEKISVTDSTCERFFINLSDAAGFVFKISEEGQNGKIYIPKMTSKRIYDMAYDFVGGRTERITITGLREGEKVFERLWGKHEAPRVKDKGDYYEI